MDSFNRFGFRRSFNFNDFLLVLIGPDAVCQLWLRHRNGSEYLK